MLHLAHTQSFPQPRHTYPENSQLCMLISSSLHPYQSLPQEKSIHIFNFYKSGCKPPALNFLNIIKSIHLLIFPENICFLCSFHSHQPKTIRQISTASKTQARNAAETLRQKGHFRIERAPYALTSTFYAERRQLCSPPFRF